jgi:hypothetical protein
MKLDRTLNKDEIREVKDAIKAWQFQEDYFGQYRNGDCGWTTSTSSRSHSPFHGRKGKKADKETQER